jgi:hypothetical protein
MPALEKELETYKRLLPELLAKQGKFVLIRGDEQAGIFDTYQDAITAGYAKFGLDPFLVKQISPAEQIAYFTRALVECRA